MRSIAIATVLLVATLPLVAQEAPVPGGIPEEAQALLDEIDAYRDRVAGLDDRFLAAEGEEALILQRRIVREQTEGFEAVQSLARMVIEKKAAGEDVAALEAVVLPMMQGIRPAVERISSHRREAALRLMKKRDQTSASERPVIERLIDDQFARLDDVYRAYWEHIVNMEALELNTSEERADLTARLVERSETLSARIELASEQKEEYEARLKDLPGDAALIAEVRASQKKLEGSIRSLTVAVDVLGELEVDATEYRELLIEASGHLTTDVLDTGVVVSLIRNWIVGLKNWVVDNGPGMVFKIFLLAAILFIFRMLSRIVREIVRKAIRASKLNFTKLLQEMIVSMAGNAVMVLGIMVGLSQLGITLGPLLAGLGIAGFVLGFALQDTLSNFAAGMMILLYRPYDVGDLVEAVGVFGTVSKMSLVSTTILTLDHQTLIVPNAKIWGDVIKNVTAQDRRRVDLVFGISYGDDILQAEKILAEIVETHDKVLDDPEPTIKVHELGDSSVNFVVRPWVKTEDYWNVYWDITREVKLRFDREGVSIPFPQRDVHLHQASGTESA